MSAIEHGTGFRCKRLRYDQPKVNGGLWTLLALIATLTFIVLVGTYVAEHRANSAWGTIRQPMSVSELVREWITCVGLFGGLSPLLHGALRFACSIVY